MAMEVVDLKDEQCIWVPVGLSAETLYVGQLVKWSNNGGVANAGQASGRYDVTGVAILAGIVTGVNDVTQTNDTTYSTVSITGLTDGDSQATQTARTYFGQEGMFSKGDPQPLVEIALIDSTTRIKAPFYSGSYGSALNLQTVTTGSTDGLGFTANASDQAGVADRATSYCRTGANAGLYRVSDDTSTTVLTFDYAWPQDIAIGDTFARLPICLGLCEVQTGTEAQYLEADDAAVSNGWHICVEHIDMREAGKEHIIFRFMPTHFGVHAASAAGDT